MALIGFKALMKSISCVHQTVKFGAWVNSRQISYSHEEKNTHYGLNSRKQTPPIRHHLGLSFWGFDCITVLLSCGHANLATKLTGHNHYLCPWNVITVALFTHNWIFWAFCLLMKLKLYSTSTDYFLKQKLNWTVILVTVLIEGLVHCI